MSDRVHIPEIVLASASPRRRMLLEQIGIQHIVAPADVEELNPTNGNFAEIVKHNAAAKAELVSFDYPNHILLAADTMVDLDGAPLGKPADKADAKRMLQMLSGRSHKVHTGIAILPTGGADLITDCATTEVWFREMSEVEIDDYIATGEPMDKAGSYGIQERGALFERVEGCFFNVMGLPLSVVWKHLLSILNG